MKKDNRNKIYLIILSLLFTSAIIINPYFSHYLSSNYGKKDSDTVKSAGYWEIGPIIINDLSPSANWLMTAATNDWCSGSGTINDPYLIENVTINAAGSNYGITILYSNVHFIIRNCTPYNAYYGGIYLLNISNGKIINNNCSDSNNFGIFLSDSDNNYIINNTANNHLYISSPYSGIHLENGCDNNVIKGNTVNNNDYGIYLRYSNTYNEIQNNTINNNRLFGIYFFVDDNSITNNKIIENVVNYNGERGIFFYTHYGTCNYNEISRNIVHDNGLNGMFLWHDTSTSGSCRYNEIIGNSISNNGNTGIILGGYTDDNEISGNNITKSAVYGLRISPYGDNNINFNNTFINNTVNAFDEGTGNQWDNGSLGNYWDDYSGVDANDDGIGDTPYDVPPTGGSVDNYPIWEDGDDLGPNITINSPSMNDAFGITAPDYDITITDVINTTWYTIDGGLNNYTFLSLTGTINQTAWDNKGTEEIMTLRFYANDSLGHIWYKDVTIWKDLVAPQITINSPISNQLCGIDPPTFSLTIIEPNILTKKYSLNGRPNITFTTHTEFDQTEWDFIGNGTVSITFYVIDKVGNMNSTEVTVRKDAFSPNITIYSPLSSEKFGEDPPTFNISISEETSVSTWYTLTGVAGQNPFTGLTGTINQGAWDLASNGQVTITFYAQDNAGNIGYEDVIILKDVFEPPVVNDTVSTIADKDTYVNSYHGISNYGDQTYLLAGYYLSSDIVETYFHFPFDDKPDNWVKAEISLDIWGISQTLTLSFCIIEEDWDEYTLTFVDFLEKGTHITKLVVTQSDVYKIDISEYIQGRNGISICVYIHTDDYVNDYAYITSREGYISETYAPKLIWTFEREVSDEGAIYGYNLLLVIGIVSVISVIMLRRKTKGTIIKINS